MAVSRSDSARKGWQTRKTKGGSGGGKTNGGTGAVSGGVANGAASLAKKFAGETGGITGANGGGSGGGGGGSGFSTEAGKPRKTGGRPVSGEQRTNSGHANPGQAIPLKGKTKGKSRKGGK